MSKHMLLNPELEFGAITFFTKEHKGDTCGSNGLPLTPNSIILIGKAQVLKTFTHRNLCQYLDIIRGKHERIIVVSQYCGTPLSSSLGNKEITVSNIKEIAFQILNGLEVLHEKNLVHRNLTSENVLLQSNGDIKLFNYGLYDMTDYGQLVSFPIVQGHYTSPEVYLAEPTAPTQDPKSDIWSLGIILVELCLGTELWTNLKLGQKIRKVLSLAQCNGSIFERIAREHNAIEVFQGLESDIKLFIDLCLKIHPKDRPTTTDCFSHHIFCTRITKILVDSPFLLANFYKDWHRGHVNYFAPFTITEFYYWWQLTGGDVHQELKKQSLIRTSPPILSLPSVVTIEGATLGQERNPATLYDPRVVKMPHDALFERLGRLPLNCYYPLLYNTSLVIDETSYKMKRSKNLPLIIREKDPEYQFHRVILFRRLLYGYPSTIGLLSAEAEIDVPPLLRGEIWAVLLNIKAIYKWDCDKSLVTVTSTSTDRQIEVDIPRCHQYNELLSSAEGHRNLKWVLKTWVLNNKQYVYWQGLDSLTAPFLYLNFNQRELAHLCLTLFVKRYLHNFFLKDNSMVIQEYLAKFSQLIVFHDPVLANHLQAIGFHPELFAIPWFLTAFSHVFPLYKIFHLWDKLLLCDSSFPLHIGLAVLTQLRSRLLDAGFNECILLFSDLPEVDIERIVALSMGTFTNTPSSITYREHEYKPPKTKKCPIDSPLDITGVTLEVLQLERCPRISANDLWKAVLNRPKTVLVVDIRNPINFGRLSVINSINVPFTSVAFGESTLESVGQHAGVLGAGEKIVVIVGDEETDLESFPKFLVKCNVKKVCVLHGGFSILKTISPSFLVSQNT